MKADVNYIIMNELLDWQSRWHLSSPKIWSSTRQRNVDQDQQRQHGHQKYTLCELVMHCVLLLSKVYFPKLWYRIQHLFRHTLMGELLMTVNSISIMYIKTEHFKNINLSFSIFDAKSWSSHSNKQRFLEITTYKSFGSLLAVPHFTFVCSSPVLLPKVHLHHEVLW
jgi:hypothetical protein